MLISDTACTVWPANINKRADQFNHKE